MIYRNYGRNDPAGDFEELQAILDRKEAETVGTFDATAHVRIYKTFSHVTPDEAVELMSDFLSQLLQSADDFDVDGMEVE